MNEAWDTDTDEWIALIRSVPLRSIEDIAWDREPLHVAPVLALGMQPEKTPIAPFKGPRWWRPALWAMWKFGVFFANLVKHNDRPEKGGRHRLVPSMPETHVYRPKVSQARSQRIPSPQEHISVPRHAWTLPCGFTFPTH